MTAWQDLREWAGQRLRAARQNLMPPRKAIAGFMKAVRRLPSYLDACLATASTNAVRVVGILVFFWVVVVLVIGLFDRSTEIGEISVPKSLSDRGYTSDVAARRLRDTMAELSEKARRLVIPENKKMRGGAITLNSEAVNVVVPTVGVSLNTVTTSLRNLFGLNWHRTISGEFSISNDKLWLRLRMDRVTLYTSKFGVSVESPDDLLEDASHAIFADIRPYVAAATEKDPEAAIQIVQQAIKRLPETDETVVWWDILLGDLYGQVGKFPKAKQALQTAGLLAPRDANIHFFLALIFGKHQDVDAAIAEYDKALKLDSRLAGAFNNRGYAYSNKNDRVHALADYNKAIEIDSKFALALINRGNVYYAEKDLDNALRDYNQAVEAESENPLALTSRGNVYCEKGDYERALADYDEAIRLDPTQALAFTGRGNVYLARQDYGNARASYDEAIRLDPTDTMAAAKRASIDAFKQDDIHAATDLTAAITPNREFASAYVTRASTYERSTTVTPHSSSTPINSSY